MTAIHTGKRFWIGFDRHTPEHDPVVDRIALDFLSDFKPHIRVAGGDWQSVDQVSHFPTEDEIDLADEFEANKKAIETYGITHYMEGNHEERLRRVGSALKPSLRSLVNLARNLELRERKIRLLPYHPSKGVLKIGRLRVLHGFYTNEYVAKKMAMIYGTCCFGHTHRFQTFQGKQAFHDHVGFNIGMLGSLKQSYAEHRAPMGWAQGFVFGYLHRNGCYDLYPVRIIHGQVTINDHVYSGGK